MAVMRVWDADNWKNIAEDDFPLAIGVSPEGTIMFGNVLKLPAAWVGLNNHQLFLQTAGGPLSVQLNGAKIERAEWLIAGDTIQIDTTECTLTVDSGVFVLSPGVTGTAAVPGTPDAPKAASGQTQEITPPRTTQRIAAESCASHSFGRLQTDKGNRRLRNTLGALFAILLCAVLFVLIAIPVRITITPVPDTTSLSRFPLSIKVWERYLVLPGTYHVYAEKEGYRKLNESITVSLGSNVTVTYTLRTLPGLFDIVAQPVEGEVSIDDVVVGTTPVSIELEEGPHTVSINAQHYLPFVQTVEIHGMGVKQRLDAELQPEKTKQEIHPTSQDNETIIELTSQPPGARVLLNGEFRGLTPISLTVTSSQDHQLILSKSGFITENQTVHGKQNKESINVQLIPEYGVVFVMCQPMDATLTVDGNVMGTASRRLSLTTQPHKIEISKPGYETFKTSLTPIKDVSKKIEVQLKTKLQATAAPVSTVRKTAEGQVLRTIIIREPITFQMGASRRESGRRSNEREYQVELTRTFSISKKEVTNAEFQRFRPEHSSGNAHGITLNEMNQPVTSITWDDAAAYLNWLSKKDGLPPAYKEQNGKMTAVIPMTTGYRLPTEAEWAFVARYAGGNSSDGTPLKYPWGNQRYPSNKHGNYADSTASSIVPLTMQNYTDGFVVAAPVGTFPANAAGLYDLGGNVSEWCHDYYDVYSGGTDNVLRDPTGPAAGTYHVIRGSSWRHGSIAELRFTYRDYTNKPRDDLGFRIARYEKK